MAPSWMIRESDHAHGSPKPQVALARRLNWPDMPPLDLRERDPHAARVGESPLYSKRRFVKNKTVSLQGFTSSNVKPLRANSLPTASMQTQNSAASFTEHFPLLLHHICSANSLS